MRETLEYRYDIYIAAPPAKVWRGIVDADMTKQYVYGTRFVGKLKKGASYAYLGDGDFAAVDGEILDVDPEKRLAMTWSAHWDDAVSNDRASRVTYELVPAGPAATKVRLVHNDFDGPTATYTGSVDAWPMLLSSLKSLVETGKPLEIK